MTIHVVSNRKLDLTDDEWAMYQKIVKSYTTATNKGEDLFMELFETNDLGIITFLRPPSKYRTSLEVYLFLTSIMVQQHIRVNYSIIQDLANQLKDKMKLIDDKLELLDKDKSNAS